MTRYRLATICLILTPLIALAPPAFAGSCPADSLRPTYTHHISECTLDPDQTGTDFYPTIRNIFQLVLAIIGVAAILIIILGAFFMITSQGDANKFARGRTAILYGAIGLAVAILSYTIVTFILNNIIGGS